MSEAIRGAQLDGIGNPNVEMILAPHRKLEAGGVTVIS